ncbi:hypothetical protein AC579_82 [Pseudocercospora musae]|uniref:Uncharacterized protein n=1 Tax=Pseudocercospora musae TaxID=113226 RepID=A0A139IHR7_9PEZI|nr:hypothetical protein AC579_82 [Pseudocercospora musae]
MAFKIRRPRLVTRAPPIHRNSCSIVSDVPNFNSPQDSQAYDGGTKLVEDCYLGSATRSAYMSFHRSQPLLKRLR